MRDWERDMVEPCLLAREIEVALDIEAVSFICKYLSVVKVKNRGKPLLSSVGRVSTKQLDVTRPAYVIIGNPVTATYFLFLISTFSSLYFALQFLLPGLELQS
jgi:hypothetical protein